MNIFTDFWQYMPHGMCLLWQPWLVILWAGSDILIFLAYSAIPIALLRVLLKRDDLKHPGLILLFASFIMLCGITHALSVVTLWVPIYPLHGVVKLLTGLVSALTAIVLFRLIPALVAIPSLNKLEEANRLLREEIAAHKQTEAGLMELKEELESKVAERTEELELSNSRLSIIAREAVHRSRNLISVVHSMARQSARGATDLASFIETFLGRLNALSSVTTAIIQSGKRASIAMDQVVKNQLAPVLDTFEERITISGPALEIGSDAAQHISLVLHELATNAHKHGALASGHARISVSWSRNQEQSGEDRVILRWQEDVPGQAPAGLAQSGAQGFGTRLLTQILPAMLQGRASRQLQDGQLRYELNVPLNAVVPDRNRSDGVTMAARINEEQVFAT